METKLTNRIKLLTHTYKPQMSTGAVGRTIRYADEVMTPTGGRVDSIRFEDYVCNRFEDCRLINFQKYIKSDRALQIELEYLGHTAGICKLGKDYNFPNPCCHGCINRIKEIREVDMLVTAYEIKITKQDFLSKNGHNIDNKNNPIANENYYCVPKELVNDIRQYIPDHVGIISYYNGSSKDGLRMVKPAERIAVEDKVKIIMLYNAMKKWCDGKQEVLKT